MDKLAKQLEKAGVDMLHVSGGMTIKRGSSIPAAGTKLAAHAHLSEEIKKAVSIPTGFSLYVPCPSQRALPVRAKNK